MAGNTSTGSTGKRNLSVRRGATVAMLAALGAWLALAHEASACVSDRSDARLHAFDTTPLLAPLASPAASAGVPDQLARGGGKDGGDKYGSRNDQKFDPYGKDDPSRGKNDVYGGTGKKSRNVSPYFFPGEGDGGGRGKGKGKGKDAKLGNAGKKGGKDKADKNQGEERRTPDPEDREDRVRGGGDEGAQ